MAIPQVAEQGEPVRFFGCWSCRLLFAFVGDRLAVEFAEDGQGGWQVFRSVDAEPAVQRALAAVAQVKREPKWDARLR